MKEEQENATFYLKRNSFQGLVTRDGQLERSGGRAWAVDSKAKMADTQFKFVFLFNSLLHPPANTESILQISTK